jgi:hypothetical protein
MIGLQYELSHGVSLNSQGRCYLSPFPAHRSRPRHLTGWHVCAEKTSIISKCLRPISKCLRPLTLEEASASPPKCSIFKWLRRKSHAMRSCIRKGKPKRAEFPTGYGPEPPTSGPMPAVFLDGEARSKSKCNLRTFLLASWQHQQNLQYCCGSPPDRAKDKFEPR